LKELKLIVQRLQSEESKIFLQQRKYQHCHGHDRAHPQQSLPNAELFLPVRHAADRVTADLETFLFGETPSESTSNVTLQVDERAKKSPA
jgi:hypothetical protein